MEEASMANRDSGPRGSLGIVGAAVAAALAGIALGEMSSDTARYAGRAFDPALLCRPQTGAALQARVAQRVQSGREP
jgi:hypothetical protein